MIRRAAKLYPAATIWVGLSVATLIVICLLQYVFVMP